MCIYDIIYIYKSIVTPTYIDRHRIECNNFDFNRLIGSVIAKSLRFSVLYYVFYNTICFNICSDELKIIC